VYPGFHPGLFSAVPSGLDWHWFFVKFDKIRSFLVVLERWQSCCAAAKYCSLRRSVQGLRFCFAQRCRAKGFLPREKGTLASGTAKNPGALDGDGVVSEELERLAKAESLRSKIGLGDGGASAAEPGVGWGPVWPGSSSSSASEGVGSGSMFSPCWRRSQAAL
jgi:hypothetical protein